MNSKTLMLRSSWFLFIFAFKFIHSEFYINCPNGRTALYTFDISTYRISAHCPIVGQLCNNKKGKCNQQNICCPSALKMSSKSRLYDRLTNIRFTRLGEDHNKTYRLYELNLLPSKVNNDDHYDRWLFFEQTLRDLFEMPNARFWYLIKNCMENFGVAYAFVPLNSTSITSDISAMTILTRRNQSMDSIYVCYMATRREHRRRGLGTRLLQQIVQRALDERKNGITSITLNVNTLNTVAIQLYERCGWRCFAYLPEYLEPEAHHVTNHAYAFILRLENVKNITNLCRESNAVKINPADDVQSLKYCHRQPLSL